MPSRRSARRQSRDSPFPVPFPGESNMPPLLRKLSDKESIVLQSCDLKKFYTSSSNADGGATTTDTNTNSSDSCSSITSGSSSSDDSHVCNNEACDLDASECEALFKQHEEMLFMETQPELIDGRFKLLHRIETDDWQQWLTTFRAINVHTLEEYCLRRYQQTATVRMISPAVVRKWMVFLHSNVVQLKEVFTTNAFGDHCKCINIIIHYSKIINR